MALGFQDCCNSNSYFYLSDNPTFVSQNEVYFIMTDDGNTFCAQYVNVPSLNYLPPTYSVLEMTQFTSCNTCLNYSPCPTTSPINLIGDGAVIAVNDCALKTQFPLEVICYTVNPTIPNPSGGIVGLSFNGGVPPYKLYRYVGGNYIQDSTSPTPQTNSPIYSNVVGGEYLMKLIDGNQEEVFLTCNISIPAPQLTTTLNKTDVNFYGDSNGSIIFTLGGGTPPYFVTYNSVTTQLDNNSYSLPNLVAGTYTFQFSDSGEGSNSQQTTPTNVTITQPQELNWPNYLCLSLVYCENTLQLFFNKTTQYLNLRPKYSLSNQSKSTIGYQPNDDFFIYFDTSESVDKWTTGSYFINSQTIGALFNGECVFNSGSQFLALNNTTTNPLQSLPQNGTWVAPPESYFLNSNLSIISSIASSCPIVIQGSVTNACGSVANGSVTISVLTGSGTPPFTFYKQGVPNGNNPVFGNLQSGTYTFYVIDANGVQSNTLTKVVSSTNNISVVPQNSCLSLPYPIGNGYVFNQNLELNINFAQTVSLTTYLFLQIRLDRFVSAINGPPDPYNDIYIINPLTFYNFTINGQDITMQDEDFVEEFYDGQVQSSGVPLPQQDYFQYTTIYYFSSIQTLDFTNSNTFQGVMNISYGISNTGNGFQIGAPTFTKLTASGYLSNFNLFQPQCGEVAESINLGESAWVFQDAELQDSTFSGQFTNPTNTNPCSAQP